MADAELGLRLPALHADLIRAGDVRGAVAVQQPEPSAAARAHESDVSTSNTQRGHSRRGVVSITGDAADIPGRWLSAVGGRSSGGAWRRRRRGGQRRCGRHRHPTMIIQHWGSLLIGMCVTELMQMGQN